LESEQVLCKLTDLIASSYLMLTLVLFFYRECRSIFCFAVCWFVATPTDSTLPLFFRSLTATRLAKGGKCAGNLRVCCYPADINAAVSCATLMSLYSVGEC
jgi:hypothetical protein